LPLLVCNLDDELRPIFYRSQEIASTAAYNAFDTLTAVAVQRPGIVFSANHSGIPDICQQFLQTADFLPALILNSRCVS
jgi:hypothetical protein